MEHDRISRLPLPAMRSIVKKFKINRLSRSY